MQPKCFSVLVALAFVLVAAPLVAQKGGGESHCTGLANTDIGPLFSGQPNGTFVTAAANCSVPDCHQFWNVTCAGGEGMLATFCQGGGSATWDTALQAFNPSAVPIACNDDFCALQSQIAFVANAGAGTYQVRVDSFGDVAAGAYTVAFSAPGTCDIEGAIPVQLQSIGVE
jgi:hypothetical protein